MITNNNLFKIKKEKDIYEIINDNKFKSIFILFVYKLDEEQELELLKLCNNNSNIIILIALINEYIPEGNIIINKIPEIITIGDNINIREDIRKIIKMT